MDETVVNTDASIAADLDAIISQLTATDRKFPSEAMKAALENHDAITPRLIQLIETATELCRQGCVVENDGHFYATYLLAELHASEAWPAVRAAATLPGELPFELYGDAITEDFGFLFAALVGNRIDALDEVMADRQVNPYVRRKASEAMLHLILNGAMTRESVIEKLTGHLRQAIDDGDEFAEGLVYHLGNLGAESALPLIETAFNRGLVTPYMLNLESIRKQLSLGEEAIHQSGQLLRRPNDLIAYLGKFAAGVYDDAGAWPKTNPAESVAFENETSDLEFTTTNERTIRNEGAKVGRNDPCLCGSGKKHKKCCAKK
ncbi:DUF1186 domain-containing protein [Rhodopirellula sp. MGV]|uniref:DUF1186 domain-containing protein n=1 Tax=Rhodopirellula sp. MGV TaxID=2023130 RepID=UPI0013045536|nr:DUF1186 domain-containing protein [Rhodopirellula sp. MGV]